MAKLTVYVNRAVRCSAAKQMLIALGIDHDVVDVETNPEAIEFLESQGREIKYYPLPQFYVGETLAWENGFKDIVNLTAQEINQRVEEINAANP